MTGVKRGRPRDEAIDAAIIDATIEELIAHGFAGLSMEAVAARAGIAKTTLYRRWSNTKELAIAAMCSFEQSVQGPPEGSVRDQLVCLVDAMRRKWNDPRYSAIMRRITGDGVSNPEAYRQGRDRIVTPHIRLLDRVLRRGVDDGVIRPDADLVWVRQMITSPIMAATLTLRDRVSKAQIETTVDTVLRGLAP
ncbi:MAG TPA: TetR/AcrR family transcriptional regulator [Jatrophihabitans sp.]|jgi:AraC-like DNA-binding protein|nr:TetR/AcrR family transcriptional regulator [Jatrophihabitans sp.]